MLELGWTLNPMTDILIRKKRKTEGRDICEDRAVVGDRIPKAKELQEPPEAGRGRDIWISQTFRGTWSSDTVIWDFGFPDFERITSYCFKPPICADLLQQL